MILVTGATGFLGNQLVTQLLAGNQPVRILCRNPNRLNQHAVSFDPAAVEIASGDVTQPSTLVEACKGIHQVYHVAGLVDFNPRDLRELLAVNEQGTDNLLSAAKKAGVQRVVHVSSVSTIGAAMDFEHPLAEDDFGTGRGLDIPYPQSKYRGEKVALRHAREGLDVVIANPTFFCGPADWNLSSARMILSFCYGQQWFGLATGGMGFSDGRDVANGLIAAMERGKAGRRYILGGTNLRLRQFHEILSAHTGRPVPRWQISSKMAMCLVPFGRAFYRLTGRTPRIGFGDVRMGREYWVYRYDRARDELGLSFRSPEETLRDTLAWLESAGHWRR